MEPPAAFPSSQREPPPLATQAQRRAVIDIGTNSVKLLVADVTGRVVSPVIEQSRQTRLGRGFYETHLLQADSIAATAAVVRDFQASADAMGANKARVIATSAARDALNACDLIRAVEESSGLKMEVISGDQEADWVFRGVAADHRFLNRPLLILDVGGGSTEFVLGEDETQYFRNSFGLGTVRLLERLKPTDPPAPMALGECRQYLDGFVAERIAPGLSPVLKSCSAMPWLVGTGGTTTILGCMQLGLSAFVREEIEAVVISQGDVRRHLENLWALPLSERVNVVGLPANRADVILTGLAIYEAVMRAFSLGEMRISTRGLRYAACLETS